MGGGHGPQPPFPSYVWSPLGAPYGENAPISWKRNTVIASLGILAVAYQIYRTGAALERRSIPARPIPSQSWAAHTLEDDPEYPYKVALEENQRSIWSRISPFTD